MRISPVPISLSFRSFSLTAGMVTQSVKPKTMAWDRIELLGRLILQSKGYLHLYYAYLYR